MINETIDLLGFKAVDTVTGYAGVISSVSFDLYGCVQCAITPAELDKEGKIQAGNWLDVGRLKINKKVRVLSVPNFEAMAPEPAKFNHGPAEKPIK